MDYSGDIEIALFELGKAQESHTLAVEFLYQMEKLTEESFEQLQKSKNDISKKELYDNAFQKERAAERNVRLAMDCVKKKQSRYDKLKQQAAAAKRARKAQKEYDAWEQKRSERKQKKKQKESENNNKNESDHDNEDGGEEPRGRNKFLRDGYQSPPPAKRKFPRTTLPAKPAAPSAWKTACDQALNDRSQMITFPDPPYKGCGNRSCLLMRKQRALKACRCNIVDAFLQDPEYSDCMKTERLRWHPDKFSVCPEVSRAVFMAKAMEVFVVANHLWVRDGKAD